MSIYVAALALLGAFGQATHAEVFVRPSQMYGWNATTYSPAGRTSAGWFLGTMAGADHPGQGALWLYSGASDGIAYAESGRYKGVRLSDLKGLTYSTFTALQLGNIAPILSVNVDVTGDGKGDLFLLYSPEMNCQVVPRGRWTGWDTLEGRWWSSKDGPTTLKSIGGWLSHFGVQDAKVDTIRIQVGTWDPAAGRLWSNSWFGADLVGVRTVSGATLFNFEPDLPMASTTPLIRPTTSIVPAPTLATVIVLPTVIMPPVFYINVEGTTVYVNGKRDELPSPDVAPKEWRADESAIFVPVQIRGNGSLEEYIADCELTKDVALRLGAVPFIFRSGKNNCWFSHHDDKSGQRTTTNDQRTLSVPINLDGVQKVYTLINTYWGVPEIGRLFIELRFKGGRTHLVEMRGNRDIREYGGDKWTKSIEKPTTQVWGKSDKRIDMQTVLVPASLQELELQEIRIVDNGADARQRAFLAGLTLQVKKKSK